MGMPKCPKCGKRITQTEGTCPCGQPIELTDKEKKRVKSMQDSMKRARSSLVAIAVCAFVSLFLAAWIASAADISFGKAYGIAWGILTFLCVGLVV